LAVPSGTGEALMISSQTSRAAARMVSGLPLDAFSQIASILARSAPVGIALAPCLQDSTAAAVVGEVAVEPVVRVLVVGVLVAVEFVAGVLTVVPVLLVVPALVELLLELPQPLSNATAASEANSQVESMRIV
jgi:hypothetical protein